MEISYTDNINNEDAKWTIVQLPIKKDIATICTTKHGNLLIVTEDGEMYITNPMRFDRIHKVGC